MFVELRKVSGFGWVSKTIVIVFLALVFVFLTRMSCPSGHLIEKQTSNKTP